MNSYAPLKKGSAHVIDNGTWQYEFMFTLGLVIGGGTSRDSEEHYQRAWAGNAEVRLNKSLRVGASKSLGVRNRLFLLRDTHHISRNTYHVSDTFTFYASRLRGLEYGFRSYQKNKKCCNSRRGNF